MRLKQSPNKNTLDFIIIGAQKAGTTTLFSFLKKHPKIYMPPEKEAPFFSHDKRYVKGLGPYIKEFFDGAPINAIWGKATPYYMMGYQSTSVETIAERIKTTFPNVKLIAILRNPIERAISHYRMSLRRGLENRSFEEAVHQLLDGDALKEARMHPTETNSYIIQGEYARILNIYYQLFERGHLFIAFTEELESNPGRLLKAIFNFLEVDDKFVSFNLKAKCHIGGTKRRIPWLYGNIENWPIFQYSPLRFILLKIPAKFRRQFNYWFEQWNILKDDGGKEIDPSVRDKLKKFYQKDMEALARLLNREIPWRDFSSIYTKSENSHL